MRYHDAPIRVTNKKILTISRAGKDAKHPHVLLVEKQNGTSSLDNVLPIFYKIQHIYHMTQQSHSQVFTLEQRFSIRGYFVLWDFFFLKQWWGWVLLLFSGQKPGMLLNVLQCEGWPSTTKNYPDQHVIVPRLRNPAYRNKNICPYKICTRMFTSSSIHNCKICQTTQSLSIGKSINCGTCIHWNTTQQ